MVLIVLLTVVLLFAMGGLISLGRRSRREGRTRHGIDLEHNRVFGDRRRE